jgi:hypothetical protein
MQFEEELIRVPRSTEEKDYVPFNGWIGLATSLISVSLTIFIFTYINGNIFDSPEVLACGIGCIILSIMTLRGYLTVAPKEAVILTCLGNYVGTIKENGFFFINPFLSREKISLKSKNLNGAPIKVNDKIGNPIEIAVVIVWRIENTAKAYFDVEDYTQYLTINSESAIRHVASSFPYDCKDENQPSLRSLHPDIINTLIDELKKKTKHAGIAIDDAKITHLAYSPEIANSMLKSQQAEATILAREKIVQGACGIVRDSINSLRNMDINFTDDQKAHLVTNLMVVLCSENQVNPVVNV